MKKQHGNTTKWLDRGVIDWAIKLFKPDVFIDIGCGLGGTSYVSNVVDCVGIDMDDQDLPGFVKADLRKSYPIIAGQRKLVYTNQCFEHLNKKAVENALKIINDKVVALLFCAATKKQSNDGIGHINCKHATEWVDIIEKETGMTYSDSLTDISLRKSTMPVKGRYGTSFWVMSGLIFVNKDLYE